MGKCFSDPVEQALQDIYYRDWEGKGQEGFALLEKASAAGDGDASCILARCLCGYQYVWSGHGFPEDDQRATKLLHKSVEQGSALGILVSLRSGELTPSVQKKMTMTLQEAFQQVLQKAEAGDAFCQYTIGNSYFWWDFLRIQDKGKDSFPNEAAFKAYLKENISQCEGWFQKALHGGVHFAANNLNHYYTKGDEDIIAPQPEKAKDLFKIGAEYGHPLHQYFYGDELSEAGDKVQAFQWYKRSAEGGHVPAWFKVGYAYEMGEGVEQDVQYAAQCYEKGIPSKQIGCHNRLGALYFKGEGVPQDYGRAYQLLRIAYEAESTWGTYYLGKCAFEGLGVQQDYVLAREYLEKMDWNNNNANFMLGYIYGRGLGVPEDIPKAVALLQKAGNEENAKKELLNYKKTLFGKWVRRK